jgi:hypothetical protein
MIAIAAALVLFLLTVTAVAVAGAYLRSICHCVCDEAISDEAFEAALKAMDPENGEPQDG